ncbi:MAG: phosphoribosylamine--glycine ligase [bacterium]|nr:phosphoribosylamine--glycine ligase [bacterium]
MNVLILGSGGREHALAWKIAKSPLLTTLYVAPGNPGINFAECLPLDILNFNEVEKIVNTKQIDLIIPGSETPLVAGIADYFIKKGVMVFGPNKKAAQLEGSKCFSKDILEKYSIPTAKFQNFTNNDEALAFCDKLGYPVVIKADGLAAGKGVVIIHSHEEAVKTLHEIMTCKLFGDAGNRVVIEEFLKGYEVSLHLLVSDTSYKLLPFSQDHKQIFDGDKGPNTGGMGAYAPCPLVNDPLLNKIESLVIKPFLSGLKKENIKYTGILYIGLMIANNTPSVLEFNVRLGDPETQVLLPLLKTDLLETIIAAAKGSLNSVNLECDNKYAVGVTLASKGYPESSEKNIEIFGLDELKNIENILIFHAGTKQSNNKILTNGGRVLTVVAFSDTFKKTIDSAYKNIKKIKFQGMQFRRDIAQRDCLKNIIS